MQGMFLIRRYRRDRKLSIGLIPVEDLRARHPEITRPAKRQTLRGLGTLVESTGKHDMTRVSIFPRRGAKSTDARGTDQTIREHGIPLTEVKDRVRRIQPKDLEALEEIDQRIEATRETLRTLRFEREAHVKAAWGRARYTVTGGDLEKIAQITKEVRQAEHREADLGGDRREALAAENQKAFRALWDGVFGTQ